MIDNPYQSPADIPQDSPIPSPLRQAVRVRGSLSWEDAVDLHRLMGPSTKQKIRTIVVFAVVLLASLMFALIQAWQQRSLLASLSSPATLAGLAILAVIFVVAFLFIFSFMGRPHADKKSFHQRKGIYAEVEYVIAEDGVRVVGEDSETFWQWRAFCKFEPHEKLLLLYVDDSPPMVVPIARSFFHDDEQWWQVVEFARHQVPAARLKARASNGAAHATR